MRVPGTALARNLASTRRGKGIVFRYKANVNNVHHIEAHTVQHGRPLAPTAVGVANRVKTRKPRGARGKQGRGKHLRQSLIQSLKKAVGSRNARTNKNRTGAKHKGDTQDTHPVHTQMSTKKITVTLTARVPSYRPNRRRGAPRRTRTHSRTDAHRIPTGSKTPGGAGTHTRQTQFLSVLAQFYMPHAAKPPGQTTHLRGPHGGGPVRDR